MALRESSGWRKWRDVSCDLALASAEERFEF